MLQSEDPAMREEQGPVQSWLRRDLGARFGTVLDEAVPNDMLALLHQAGVPD